MNDLPPKKRDARPGVTLIDPASEAVYLTLWPHDFDEWAVLVLNPEEDLFQLEEEIPGGITFVLTTWVEHVAEEP